MDEHIHDIRHTSMGWVCTLCRTHYTDAEIENKLASLEHIEGERDKMREAARPFSKWIDTIYAEQDAGEIKEMWATVGDLRKLAAALKGK